jgi:ketosteroid isomerase-like protein
MSGADVLSQPFPDIHDGDPFMRWMLAAAVFVIVMAGCGERAQPLKAADRAAIEAATQAFGAAAKAGDWNAIGALYTEDALVMPPNAPAISGRPAIVQFFSSFPPITEMTLTNVEVEGSDGIAYVRGTYQMTIAMPGQAPIEETGKYLAIHRKQADGSWPLSRDMFSSDHPASPAAADSATAKGD